MRNTFDVEAKRFLHLLVTFRTERFHSGPQMEKTIERILIKKEGVPELEAHRMAQDLIAISTRIIELQTKAYNEQIAAAAAARAAKAGK